MSDYDTFENEGGTVEDDRDHYTYSPAAGLNSDTADAEVAPENDQDDEDADDDEVGLVAAPGFRGTFVDPETGLRFRRGRVVSVSESDAERLLSLRRRGQPVVVRADS